MNIQNMGWWAEVVNVNDPHQSGRVQIRVHGYHDDTTNIPDSNLPWALPLQPVTSAAVGRMGTAPVGIVKGSRVRGFWADPDGQYPIIIGTIGKSGDPIDGQYEYGAPKIDTTVGSITASAQGSATNYRSNLNSSVASITTYDSQGAPDSVKVSSGVTVTKAIETGMYNAKTPTIAYADKTNNSDVITILYQVDPLSKNSAIPCLNLTFKNLNLLAIAAGILGAIAGELKNILIQAITNAILVLAQKYGVFKVLSLLNNAAYAIEEVANLINALNINVCGSNIFNQGIFNSINGVIAQSLNTINTLTNTIVAGVNTITFATASTVNNVFDNLITAPLASVATSSTPIPPTISAAPPPSYVQQYYANSDPYPGYIVYSDPSDVSPDVYVLRNGQPNYTSASQHIFFNAQQTFISSMEASIINNVLTPQTLTSIFSTVTSATQAFAATKILGEGFTIAASAITLAALIPALYNNMSITFYNQPPVILGSPLIQQAVTNFQTSQILLEKKRKQAMIGVGGL
jgi:hypothetical protein